MKYKVLTSGLVNVTTTTVICCPGFYKKNKEKCKSKLYYFYLLKRNITFKIKRITSEFNYHDYVYNT